MAELRSFLLVPLANPSLLRGLGLGIAGGALLHGPPGCGKTSVARALAAEVKGVANFIEVRCSDLVDKVGSGVTRPRNIHGTRHARLIRGIFISPSEEELDGLVPDWRHTTITGEMMQ